jgi:uncharacterized membrane protein
MSDAVLVAVAFSAVLGCGLMAGVFLAFSSFVMSALARLPAPQGIAAMQSVNIRAVTPVFMTVFFGTAVLCVILAAWALSLPRASGGGFLFAGSFCYLAGSFLVTVVFNVPRNNRLAAVDPNTDAAARLWREYLRSWTAWNHVRTTAALAATGLLTLWLYRHSPGL